MWTDLVCPFDRARLEVGAAWLSCTACGRGYPVLEGIPTFLAADESPEWRRWQRDRVRQLPPPSPALPLARAAALKLRGRELEERLAAFIPLTSTTRLLQIGLDGEGELHHFRTGVRYGLEPLAGVMHERGWLRWGKLRWVAGRGEQLPFADAALDAVVIQGGLEHAEDPGRVLAEASRVLRPDGVLSLCCRLALAKRPGAARQPITARRLGEWIRQARLAELWRHVRREPLGPGEDGPRGGTAAATATYHELILRPTLRHGADAAPALRVVAA